MSVTEKPLVPEPPEEPSYPFQETDSWPSSYSNSDPNRGPRIYVPPVIKSPEYINPSSSPVKEQHSSQLLLKILLPIFVVALLLLLIGLLLLWLLRLRKKNLDGKSGKCQSLTFPNCLFCERMTKFFKSPKTRPSSNDESNLKMPLKQNDPNKPSLANEVCYDDGTHQRLNEVAQHQCQVYSQDQSSSYVMPKSEYFNKPNPYRNMPPMIDQFHNKRPIGI